MLVAGTPGVGKSAFGWVLLKFHLHAEQFNTIIVDFIWFQVMYKRTDRSQPWTVSTFNEATKPPDAQDASALLLYDCRENYPSPPIVAATTVAFSSPNREHYGVLTYCPCGISKSCCSWVHWSTHPSPMTLSVPTSVTLVEFHELYSIGSLMK